MAGRRVFILCMTAFGYDIRVRDAVERIGHTTDLMDERTGNDFFSKAAIRFGLIRLMPWRLRRHVDAIITRIAAFRPDTLLLLDPETITGKELERIKARFPNIEIVIYTWDAFTVKPIGPRAFAVADRVYSFDPGDCEAHPDLHHIPLFHDIDSAPGDEEMPKEYDFSFIGTARLRRIRTLARIARQLDAQGRAYVFHLFSLSPLHSLIYGIAARLWGYRAGLSRQRMPYAQYLDITARSRCVVDIELGKQTGLTMRTFETIFSNVPLLTTNRTVERYEFFDDAGIFLLDERAIALPPTHALSPPDLSRHFAKYHIDTWARTVLDGKPSNYFREDAPPQPVLAKSARPG